MTRLSGPALLALGLACAAPPPPATCTIQQERIGRFFLVGERADVAIGVSEQCLDNRDPALHTAVSVAAEVHDPDGALVASTVTVPQRVAADINAFSNRAVVSFTPDRVGSWLVSTRFEPELGRTFDSAEVIVDRADAGSRIVAGDFPTPCDGWGMTARGTLLCVSPHPAFGFTLSTRRGEDLRGLAFAVEGNTVWQATTIGLTRLEDDGTRLVPTHSGGRLLNGWPGLAGSGGGVWLGTTYGTSTLAFARPEADGGLAFAEVALGGLEPSNLAPHREGVLAVGFDAQLRRPTVAWFGADGGAVRVSATATGIVGSEPGAIWFVAAEGLTAAGFDGTALIRAVGRQPFGAARGQPPAPLFPRVPVVAFAEDQTPGERPMGAVARFDGATVGFERFVAGDGYLISGASPTHVFARSKDGQSVKVFDR